MIFISSLVGENLSGRWKRRSYLAFAALAVAYILLGLRIDAAVEKNTADAERTEKQLQQTVSDLRLVVDDSEKARNSDRDAFLSQINLLSKQLTDIRVNVQTESLRKQLDDTQKSLAQTKEAIEAREVKLGLVLNGEINPETISIRPGIVPHTPTLAYLIDVGLLNSSDHDAGGGHAEITLSCDDCKDIRFAGKTAWQYWQQPEGKFVGQDFVGVPSRGLGRLGELYLTSISNRFPMQVRLQFTWHCQLCVPDNLHVVAVNLVDK